MIKFSLESVRDLKDLVRRLSVGLSKLVTTIESIEKDVNTLKEDVEELKG